MNNPFLNQGYLEQNVSLNKLKLAKLPLKDIQDDIEGRSAFGIFSTNLLIDKIKEHSNLLKLDMKIIKEKDLPIYLADCIDSSDLVVSSAANNIVKLFGERLGLILLTLKKGEEENMAVREDWKEEHWNYWKYIKTVILLGGLASGKLGQALKSHIYRMFDLAGEGYDIILGNDSQNAGIIGCASYIDEKDSNNLIFDFGQTYIKRSLICIKDGKIASLVKFENMPSQYIESDSENINLEKLRSIKLHDYLVEVISDTYDSAINLGQIPDELIVSSIANYIKSGVLAGIRGGYAKLRLLSDNYENYLSKELSERLKRNIMIKLIHDGTAMAAGYKNYDRAVCISLGTAFGVGFPHK